LDEECVFLLCSDGLSDRDRVEQYWETEILPVLDGQVNVATAAQRLVQIGNTQNGHDNVTVALVYCQVKLPESPAQIAVSLPQLHPAPTSSTRANRETLPPHDTLTPDARSPNTKGLTTLMTQPERSQMKTRRLPVHSPSPSHPRAFAASFLVLGLIGSLAAGLGYWLIPGVKQWVKQLIGDGRLGNRSIESPVPLSVPAPLPNPTNSPNSSLIAGSFIRLQGQNTLAVLPIASTESQTQSVQLIVPDNGILQVVEKQPLSDTDSWVQLQLVCPNTKTNKSTASTPPTAEKTGWIQETALKPLILRIFKVPSDRLEKCE
jgi:hypothetical protein